MKVAVVTGCSRGIGKKIVERILSEDNTFVYGIARNKERLEDFQANFPGRFDFIAGDITQKQSIINLCALIKAKGHSVDYLILNAGILTIGRIRNQSFSKFLDVISANLSSNFYILQQMIPLFSSKSPTVVAISSGASTIPFAGWSGYCASKAALNSLIAVFVAEEPWITAVSVCPGVVDTDMQTQLRTEGMENGMDQEQHDYLSDLKMAGKLKEPSEVADRIVHDLLLNNSIAKSFNGKVIEWDDNDWVEWKR